MLRKVVRKRSVFCFDLYSYNLIFHLGFRVCRGHKGVRGFKVIKDSRVFKVLLELEDRRALQELKV